MILGLLGEEKTESKKEKKKKKVRLFSRGPMGLEHYEPDSLEYYSPENVS